MKVLNPAVLCLYGLIGLTSLARPADVVINEIMFHASSHLPVDDWLELHNPGNTATNLSGWKLTRGVDFTFTNAVLPAHGYLVVAANVATFKARYPSVSNVIGGWTGTLNNTGEEIELSSAAGDRVDLVPYADEGDWAVRERGPQTGLVRGWVWFKETDGLGKSTELINPALPNQYGQNWAASAGNGGTPGAVNSMASANGAPLILEVQHFPLIPTSADPIFITARIVDEAGPAELSVTLYERIDAATLNSFTTVPMFDDGAHGDGAANDGRYGARLLPQANNAIIEFYVEVEDAELNRRTWPAPARENGTFANSANALLQVDDAPLAGTSPMLKLILPQREYNDLSTIFNQSPNSDAQVHGTVISIDGAGTEVHYLVGARNRGHGSRSGTPHNYRINFRGDEPWQGVGGINLNARNPHAQHFGAILSQRSGVAGADSRAMRLRVNNGTGPGGSPGGGHYAANEVLDSDWADKHFPNDNGGNVYRAIRDIAPSEFNYRGPNKTAYQNTYFKNNNVSADNWSDLIGMLRVVGTNDLFNTDNVTAVVNVEQWLTHLAVMNLLGSSETGLNSGYNDDYFMYAGVVDRRFILLYYDLDSILGQGSFGTTAGIFSATQNSGSGTAFNRLIRWPEFELMYYRILQRLIDTTFSAAQYNALIDQTLGGYVSSGVISSMKTWMDGRRSYVQGVISPFVRPDEIPPVATIVGEPRSPTPFTTAVLTVGGAGVTHYRYRLNNGLYGSEVPVTTPIQLGGLPNGSTNTVSVIGRNVGGFYQSAARAAISASWIVNTAWPAVRINEVLAANGGAIIHEGTFPDIIELYNESATALDLSGFRLSDDVGNPAKFSIPAGTMLGGNQYLQIYALSSDGTSGLHTGFGLEEDGDNVFLFSPANLLLDSVRFGRQVAGLSVARVLGGSWALAQPSPGATNVLQTLAPQAAIKINEWLALGQSPIPSDFVELFNDNDLPVSVGGLYLTDNVLGDPVQFRFAPLNFIRGRGFFALTADGSTEVGHLPFSLSTEIGEIALLAPDRTVVDCISYGPQLKDVASGRCPDGSSMVSSLAAATPGSPNLCATSPAPTTISVVPYEQVWSYEQSGSNLGTAWREVNYADGGWPIGAGVLGQIRSGGTLSQPLRTPLSISSSKITFYFRTRFTVPANIPLTGLQVTYLVDDGMVLYLNGQEVHRYNMPNGPVSSSTLASVNLLDTEEQTPFTLPASAFVAGQNVLAAEVHQSGATSGDIIFGLRLSSLVVSSNATGAGVVINEVFASNSSFAQADGTTPDAIELYNPSLSTVDLADMSLSDSTLNPRQWVFPSGSVITPNGFLVLFCNTATPVSAANTGFNLKASGGSLYLFTSVASGATLTNVVTYGLQISDYSIGRVNDGSANWSLTLPSLGSPNLAAPLGDASLVRINEWMAAPSTGDDWVELYNPNPWPVAIGGYSLTDDPADRDKSPMPALSFLGAVTNAWQRFEADDNPEAGADHVRFKLSAEGEQIGLYTASGAQVDVVTFGGQTTDIASGRLPDGGATIVPFPGTASPGENNFVSLDQVVINEVLSHTDLPLEDAIEVRNLSSNPVDLSGWWLSDSRRDTEKFRIPNGTTLDAHGFAVFYENQFNNNDVATIPFSLSSAKGDQVYLAAVQNGARTGQRAFADFGASENGVSFGRYVTSVGADFVPMNARTFGTDNPMDVTAFRLGTGLSNATPRIGPVVISEIMYHPPGIDTNDNLRDEYIQLHNIAGQAVPLFDPLFPANTWRLRGAVDYNFPSNTTLSAQAYVLVVSFDPRTNSVARAGFQAIYGSNMVLVGPFIGKLDNGGETVQLLKPDAPQTDPGDDFGFVPYVLVEAISYGDSTPWPASPDGQGDALHRINDVAYGNEPLNWQAVAPNPNPSGGQDSDEDGMPDVYENDHGFNPGNPADAALDADGDGVSNLSEFLSGTDPRDPASLLQIAARSTGTPSLDLSFLAIAGKSYSIQFSQTLGPAGWIHLDTVAAASTNRVVHVTTTTGAAGQRFYRVVTPSVP